ncbi:hypothetical protein EDEG_00155 [Edhazardia aedis USNM 41457]|uniref:Uncharacterized protein n=1 Tax=Edhazardia aedis (strain USNM 41457) TaxID=1003232 RepID=J9D9Q5_EDHAE|nr:hypothetical protein EDEG_00155 [Edhazardia aedis USNM 41457]|eukprot:EJW04239.1 hypothetical protein EDEG_00155 [Edhazardia aedis USNM 41457]
MKKLPCYYSYMQTKANLFFVKYYWKIRYMSLFLYGQLNITSLYSYIHVYVVYNLFLVIDNFAISCYLFFLYIEYFTLSVLTFRYSIFSSKDFFSSLNADLIYFFTFFKKLL